MPKISRRVMSSCAISFGLSRETASSIGTTLCVLGIYPASTDATPACKSLWIDVFLAPRRDLQDACHELPNVPPRAHFYGKSCSRQVTSSPAIPMPPDGRLPSVTFWL